MQSSVSVLGRLLKYVGSKMMLYTIIKKQRRRQAVRGK